MRSSIVIATTAALASSFVTAVSPEDKTAYITSMIGAEAAETGMPDLGRLPHWLETVGREKFDHAVSDVISFDRSVQENSLYPSMTQVMATAIPVSYLELLKQAPKSAHKEFEGTKKPKWYEAIPSDVRSFMDANRVAAQSIYSKDFGDLAKETGSAKSALPSSTGASLAAQTSGAGQINGNNVAGKSATSEAPDSLRIAGATAGALFGAIAVAALLM